MKNKLLIIVLVLVPTFIYAQEASKKDVKNTFAKFEQTILQNDLKGSLKYFEPDYKKMQHDKFLEGNTSQFVREFLAGAPRGEALFVTPDIQEIESIKLKKIKYNNDNEAEARIQVKLKDGRKLQSEVLIIINSATEIYFVGAVG